MTRLMLTRQQGEAVIVADGAIVVRVLRITNPGGVKVTVTRRGKPKETYTGTAPCILYDRAPLRIYLSSVYESRSRTPRAKFIFEAPADVTVDRQEIYAKKKGKR